MKKTLFLIVIFQCMSSNAAGWFYGDIPQEGDSRYEIILDNIDNLPIYNDINVNLSKEELGMELIKRAEESIENLEDVFEDLGDLVEGSNQKNAQKINDIIFEIIDSVKSGVKKLRKLSLEADYNLKQERQYHNQIESNNKEFLDRKLKIEKK